MDTTPHGWRPLFWFGAGPPVLIILFRLMLPETAIYQQHESVRRSAGAGHSATKTFISEGKVALRRHWLLLLYLVLLMTGFNFMSHGSQDLYPTMLQNQFGFNADQVTVTQVVANLGAMAGGTVVGFCSQIFGRRLSIIVMCVIGGALLYPYGFTSSVAVMAPAFFEQVRDNSPSSDLLHGWRDVFRWSTAVTITRYTPGSFHPRLSSKMLTSLPVLRPGCLGRHSHPSHGAVSRCLPHLRRWYRLPTR